MLSYVWPQTTKMFSDYNGMMEVTYINGKKVLDSKNANYSYGSLQEILEIGLSKLDFKKINSVLLLGLGGGSIVFSLRNKFKYEERITAVEFDEKMIEIAEKEFLVVQNSNLKIVHDDAFNFVKENTEQYDLIVVDLFVDQKVPKQFYSEDFCNYLYQRMSNKGSFLFNLGMNNHDDISKNEVQEYFENKFCYVFRQEKIQETNTLLTVTKNADLS